LLRGTILTLKNYETKTKEYINQLQKIVNNLPRELLQDELPQNLNYSASEQKTYYKIAIDGNEIVNHLLNHMKDVHLHDEDLIAGFMNPFNHIAKIYGNIYGFYDKISFGGKRRATAKKVTTKKVTAKKVTAKKVTAKKVTAKKVTAKKVTAKKVTPKKK